MPAHMEPALEALKEVITQQAGAVSRQQALAVGLTDSMIRRRLAQGHWQRPFSGIYVVSSGEITRDCLRWSALLYAGREAMLSHETAAEVSGLIDEPTDPIHITIPATRICIAQPGLVVHRSSRSAQVRHPCRMPPQTRIEETVIDLAHRAERTEQAVSWLRRACTRRLTTTDRLLATLAHHKKVRRRAILIEALAEIAIGCHSPLEERYHRSVEQAHRLPGGRRQQPTGGQTRRRYDDVHYDPWRLIVELDGRIAHPDDTRWRDMDRDNASVAQGFRVLRYGWHDVVDRPCAVAFQVSTVLRAGGWPGQPEACQPSCTATREVSL